MSQAQSGEEEFNPPPYPDPETATINEIHEYEAAVEKWQESLPREKRWEWQDQQYRRTDDKPFGGENYNWKRDAMRQHLPGSMVHKLDEDGFLVKRDSTFKQSFEAYTSVDISPFFITTDSILNGYHVLLEASLQRAAMHEADLLKGFLIRLYNGLVEPPKYDRFDPYSKPEIIEHCQRVLGPALLLLGEEPKFNSREVRKDVQEIVRRIREADSVDLPLWLGPPEPGFLAIDYRRMQPIGFFTRTEKLQSYFSALTWLRSVPFRIDRDLEFKSFGVMANICFSGYDSNLRALNLLGSFFGQPNGVDIETAGIAFQHFRRDVYEGKAERSKAFALAMMGDESKFPVEKMNDKWRFIPREESDGHNYNLYIFVPRVLPDSLLFHQLFEHSHEHRPLPSGLDVGAFLGSEWAKNRILSQGGESIADMIDSKKGIRELAFKQARERKFKREKDRDDIILDQHKKNPSTKPYTEIRDLYSNYLYTLEALFLEPEAEAPKWMHSNSWNQKCTETALSSWAQMRHSLSLVASRSAMYLGLIDAPPGFVEPNPEFYGRLSNLVKESRGIFESTQVFENQSADRIFALQGSLDFISKNIELEDSAAFSKMSQEEQEEWGMGISSLPIDYDTMRNLGSPENWTHKTWEELEYIVSKKLENAIRGKDSSNKVTQSDVLRKRWDALFELTIRLESLAHKQLRGKDWTESEAAFIRNYGESLAFVMLYDGNSWLTPVDDSPRIIGVHENPQVHQILHVGVGRPQAIYTLYPWKGQQILCRGSIMPYYEFPAIHWMTDSEWLEKEKESEQPEWLIE